jgi:hypothetical protein
MAAEGVMTFENPATGPRVDPAEREANPGYLLRFAVSVRL